MDFSIVVPVFNAAKDVERCVRALLLQTYPTHRYEIIIVDNNSTDRSAEIVRDGFNRLRLVREAEQGSYSARNRGSREARGEVVVFTDPDCEPRADWLEQIRYAMAGPGTGVVLGDRRFARDTGILGMLAAYESALGSHIFTTQRVECYYAYTNNMAVRGAILKNLNGFRNLNRGADSLFLRQAIERYGRSVLKYAPGAVVRHLEIDGIRDYLDKKAVYGKVNGDRALATPGSIPLASRLKVALKVQREQGGSVATRIGFIGTLVAGAIRFERQRFMRGRSST
jgi:glycosyltransferase involved in cell wall biosynthesis